MRAYMMGWVLIGALCAAGPAAAGSLEAFGEALSHLSDMTHAADAAREALEDAVHNGRDYSSYEQRWRNDELNLERERVRTIARIAGVGESTIRRLRDNGSSWASIARKYDIDPAAFGYGRSRYDADRDGWKGTPPGLAKKGGLPPGQAKKIYGTDPHKQKKSKHKD